MRSWAAIAICIIPMTVAAQDADLRATCRASDTAYDARVAACTSLIESSGEDGAAWAHERRGDAHNDNRQYDLAVPDFSVVLELDPDNELALGGRIHALLQLDRLAQAEADARRLIRLEPQDNWPPYILGRILLEQGQNLPALQAFTQSLELDLEYLFARIGRARTHRAMQNFALAEVDYRRAMQIAPWRAQTYQEAGEMWMHASQRDLARAAEFFRLAFIISPNLRDAEQALMFAAPVDELIALPPADHTPPPDGLRLRYIMDVLPEDTRDETEIAIEGIANLFGAQPKPEPEALAYLYRAFEVQEDGRILQQAEIEFEHNLDLVKDSVSIPDQAITYRGLFPSELPADADSPRRVVEYEDVDLSDLWPLAVGNSVSGSAGMFIMCPEGLSIRAALIGCTVEVEKMRVGTMQVSASVEAAEQIHVPMGTFDTFRIRMIETRSIEAMGRSVEQTYDSDIWLAPDLGTWVRHRVSHGGYIATYHAVAQQEE